MKRKSKSHRSGGGRGLIDHAKDGPRHELDKEVALNNRRKVLLISTGDPALDREKILERIAAVDAKLGVASAANGASGMTGVAEIVAPLFAKIGGAGEGGGAEDDHFRRAGTALGERNYFDNTEVAMNQKTKKKTERNVDIDLNGSAQILDRVVASQVPAMHQESDGRPAVPADHPAKMEPPTQMEPTFIPPKGAQSAGLSPVGNAIAPLVGLAGAAALLDMGVQQLIDGQPDIE